MTTTPIHRDPHAARWQRVAKELAESSGFLLARLGCGVQGAGDRARAQQAGFEIYDYSVLAILGEGDRETQSTIADALDLDPSRLVALLDSLEERGLVVRQRDPQDRRRHVVSITAAGKRELARLRELIAAGRGRVLRAARPGEPQALPPGAPPARRASRPALRVRPARNARFCGRLPSDAPRTSG